MKNILLLTALISIFSCSKKETTSTPVKKEVKPVQKENNQSVKTKNASNMTIQGDLGTIDYDMVKKKFEEAKTTIDNCIYEGVGQRAYIGGNMNFTFRIDLNGKVKRLDYKSDIGSRKVEACIYKFAKSLQFIKPKGGEAKVSYAYGFAESMEIKKKWGANEVSVALRKIKRRLNKCSDGTDSAPSTYTLVFYVLPEGALGPMGISSGKELVSENFYNCVKKNLKKAKFKDPMGTVAKVSVLIEP